MLKKRASPSTYGTRKPWDHLPSLLTARQCETFPADEKKRQVVFFWLFREQGADVVDSALRGGEQGAERP